jgi:hypothetical protein
MSKDVLDDLDDIFDNVKEKRKIVEDLEIDVELPGKIDIGTAKIACNPDNGAIFTFIARKIAYAITIVPLDYNGTSSDFHVEEDREKQVSRALKIAGVDRQKYMTSTGDQWRIRITSKEEVTADVLKNFVENKLNAFEKESEKPGDRSQ